MKLSILVGLSFAVVAHALPGRYPLASKKEAGMPLGARDEPGKSFHPHSAHLEDSDLDLDSDYEKDPGFPVPGVSATMPEDLGESDDLDEDDEILSSLKVIYERLRAKMAYSSHDRPVIRRRSEAQEVEPNYAEQTVTKVESTNSMAQASPAGRMGSSWKPAPHRIPFPERPVT